MTSVHERGRNISAPMNPALAPVPPYSISRRNVLGLGAGLAAVPLLASCGIGPSNAARGKSMTMGIGITPDTLDPGATGMGVVLLITLTMFDPLVWWLPNADGSGSSFYPGLASSYTVSPDASTYTFTLRTDVKFHDGTPFDAEAVKATYDHVVDPATKSRSGLGALGPYQETKIIDSSTVQIIFSEPNASFLHQQAAGNFGISSPTALKKYGPTGFGNNPVGTGPFMFSKYATGDRLTVVKNPNYAWGPSVLGSTGPATLDEITFRIVPDDSSRFNALQAGQLQIAMDLPPNNISTATKAGSANQLTVPSIGTPRGLAINVTKPPTDDIRVRQAILFAVNQEKLNSDVLFGIQKPAHNVLSTTTPGYSKAASALYSYNPSKAESLLDQAGWTKGANGIRSKNGQELALDILLYSGAGYELPTQFVASELTKVGFNSRTTVQPRAAAIAAYNQGVQNLASWGYYGADPYLLNIWANSNAIKSGYNYAHYSNPTVDALIAQANVTPDETQRNAVYETIGTTLMNDAIFLPMWDISGSYTTARNVQGLKPTLNGYFLFHTARLG
jgi:peptide/nickel transport system substrate-binding protein